MHSWGPFGHGAYNTDCLGDMDRSFGLCVRPVSRKSSIEMTVDYSSITLTVGEESIANIISGNGYFTVRSSDTGVATVSL